MAKKDGLPSRTSPSTRKIRWIASTQGTRLAWPFWRTDSFPSSGSSFAVTNVFGVPIFVAEEKLAVLYTWVSAKLKMNV